MKYIELVKVYDALSKTASRLEKTQIIAEFLPRLKGHEEWAYLLRGRVYPEYDVREFGISSQLTIKAIAKASGSDSKGIVQKFNKIGDLGDVAFEILHKKKQKALFFKELDVNHVLLNLRKLCEIEGAGTVDKKMDIIAELLQNASHDETRYLIRTLLSDLRVGVADATVLDAIISAFFKEDKEEMTKKVKNAYDLLTDFAVVLKMAFKGESAFEHVELIPGRPLNVMLAIKAENFSEAFEACGKPAAIEHKYDGFRVVISCDGKEIKLFTRRLEDVTNQFPDIVKFVKEHVKAESFILDSEAVGFNYEKKKYLPFEAVSQRIKRKYHIDKLVKELPVEVNVFDVLYLNGKNTVELPFKERRKIIEKIIHEEKWKFKIATQIVTDNMEEAERFYKEALKLGEEGVMIKNINAQYKPGRLVGYMVKMKPDVADLDLVVVGAEYGKGKRAGGLTSFIVACRQGDDFLEVGKVSSGLKEKSSEGTTYMELNNLLKPLIISERGNSVKVKPKVVVAVTYQNIQGSPSYNSGFALRFPRITAYRPEKSIKDIAALDEIIKEVKRQKRR